MTLSNPSKSHLFLVAALALGGCSMVVDGPDQRLRDLASDTCTNPVNDGVRVQDLGCPASTRTGDCEVPRSNGDTCTVHEEWGYCLTAAGGVGIQECYAGHWLGCNATNAGDAGNQACGITATTCNAAQAQGSANVFDSVCGRSGACDTAPTIINGVCTWPESYDYCTLADGGIGVRNCVGQVWESGCHAICSGAGDGKECGATGYSPACTSNPSPDADGDGVPNASDNCPNNSNADQADNDGDGQGNACDSTPNGSGGGGGSPCGGATQNPNGSCPGDCPFIDQAAPGSNGCDNTGVQAGGTGCNTTYHTLFQCNGPSSSYSWHCTHSSC